MTPIFAAGAQGRRVASFMLAIAFFAAVVGWFIFLALFLTLQLRWKVAGAGSGSAGASLALALSIWGLRRAVKNGHFIWTYGRWRVDEAQAQPPIDPMLQQAQQAFVDGDLERVVLLARKQGTEERGAALQAGLGRALALLGRLDEAAEAFDGCPEDREALRWLRARRAWGADWPTYFRPDDARWLQRGHWLALLLGLCLGGLFLAAWHVQAIQPAEAAPSFNVGGFETVQQGAFTVHYHDPQFRDLALDLAEKALFKQLAFFGQENADIPKGTFELYLCDDRAEYLRRAPYAPDWEQASALPDTNSIYIHKLPKDESIYFEIVLAHELCHLLYHRFYPVTLNDAWLNEGLADYSGYAFGLDRAGYARQDWLDEHRFAKLATRSIPFDCFFSIDPHTLKETEDVETFYRQGFSVVFMLVEHFGRADFLRFLNAYRDSNGNASVALAKAYPTIPDTDALASLWGLYFGKSAN